DLKSGVARAPFVGREVELGRLLDLWAGTRRGESVFAFVCGEPGIGRTRLAAEFALRAGQQGATILWGRCSPETAVSYRPLTDALRGYVARLPSSETPLEVGPGGASLVRMVPGV